MDPIKSRGTPALQASSRAPKFPQQWSQKVNPSLPLRAPRWAPLPNLLHARAPASVQWLGPLATQRKGGKEARRRGGQEARRQELDVQVPKAQQAHNQVNNALCAGLIKPPFFGYFIRPGETPNNMAIIYIYIYMGMNYNSGPSGGHHLGGVLCPPTTCQGVPCLNSWLYLYMWEKCSG